MAERKVFTTIWPEASQLERLRRVSQLTGQPVSALVREGLSLALDRFEGQAVPIFSRPPKEDSAP